MLDQSPRASAPPMVATKLMEWILPANIRDHLIGDLYEEFYQRQSGPSINGSPGTWFWWQSIRTVLLYMWKERGGLMAFVVSLLIFIGMTLMAMVLGGRLEMFIDWPSFLIVIPPAIAFGIAASSVQSYLSSVKFAFVDQLDVSRQEALNAVRFLKVTGTTAVYLGFITSLIGWVAMGENIKAYEFNEVFGSAFAVSVLTIMYGLMFKLICYTAEQKIQFRYLKE
jgi:flagellar motor component MotA